MQMSAFGTKRTSQRCFVMSAFGGKADITSARRTPCTSASYVSDIGTRSVRENTSVCRLKFNQNIRFFGGMSHQMRRIGIVPACNLDQPARLPMLV
jgi:hypothetical protein